MTAAPITANADQTDASTTIQAWAGWFHQGSASDKVWAGAVRGATFRSAWGRRGSALSRGEKAFDSPAKALKQFTAKVNEKASEGYAPVGFDEPPTGIPFLFDEQASADTPGNPPPVLASTPKTSHYITAHVLPLTADELEAALYDPRQGLSEKINGERTLIACDCHTLTAYNRKGQQISLVPTGAQPLLRIGIPCLLDGERLAGDAMGAYVCFDVLEWHGASVRHRPYEQRIELIRAAATIAAAVGPEMPVITAHSFYVLTADTDLLRGRSLCTRIQGRGGEGVILRDMDAPYQEGDTESIRKFKFLASVDCIILAVNPGLATGSITLGLLREDGTIIDVGNVRSGLKDCDITAIAAMLAAGKRPVIEIQYLLARTVGYKLVEPKTSMLKLRTDKDWHECWALQLGHDKHALITAAPAYLLRNAA